MIKLLFVGDVMLGRLVNDALKLAPAEYPWGDTLPIFQSTDWRMCNLECVISDRGQPWSQTPKVFHYRSNAKNVAVLKAAGIDVVSNANNHSLDYEYEALTEMLQVLDKTKIKHVGAGENIGQAQKAAISEVNGLKLGIIAFTDNEPGWEAKENQPGVFFVPIHLKDKRAKKLMELVQSTKQKVDLLIISAHWGPNWGYTPPSQHPAFAHALIDAGADIIFGHSCHVFNGIEIYQGKPILYSTGDFIDDYAIDEIERNDQSFIFMIEMEDTRITTLKLYPTIIKEFQARLASEKEASEIVLKMHQLCDDFKTFSEWNEKERCLTIKL